MHWYRFVQVGAAGILFAGLAVAQAPPADSLSPSAAPATPAPPVPQGSERLEAVCGTCHDPHLVDGQKRDLAGWHELIDSMIAKGAQVTDADYEIIANYLATRD